MVTSDSWRLWAREYGERRHIHCIRYISFIYFNIWIYFVSSHVGLKVQGGVRQENDDGTETMVAEITRVTPGSVADNSGQLQAGKFSKQ